MKAESKASWRVVAALVAAKLLVHAAIIGRYDYHGDELYFIECSKHLAFGYVDHPPMIPWLAWLSQPFGFSLWALRLPSLLAGGTTMVLCALLVHEWKGGRWAQLFAGFGMLFAPVYLRVHSMLDIPSIEILFWTLCTYLVARILNRGESRLWLLVGLVAGAGLLTKHSMGLWGVGLAIGLSLGPHRRLLATKWPWLGGVIALLLFVPNIVWQANNGWATVEFLSNMGRTLSAMISKPLFLAGQVLYMHPLALPVWGLGLWTFFRKEESERRVFGWLYVTPLIVFLFAGAKPYYLAPAYPALFASGAIVVERYLKTRPRLRRAYVGAWGLTGSAFALCVLPILPIRTIDGAIDGLLGWAVPAAALTHDLHAEFGWREHARAVRGVYEGLSAEERGRTTIIAGSYSQASAARFFAPDLPPAGSGHLSYSLWHHPWGDVTIAWGLSESWLVQHFDEVEEAGRVEAPLARHYDTDVPIYVCRGPRTTAAERWHRLRNLGNSGSHPSRRVDLSVLRER